jgi:uncharacterized protein YdaU (DUF1376 family)
VHHYPHHIGDYRSSTSHLSDAQDLAYRRLLEMYYDTERPISLDTQWVATRLRLGSDVLISVLNDQFQEREDGWHKDRCDREIAKYHQMAERNRANGAKGGRRKNPVATQREPSGNPGLSQPEPRTKNREPDNQEPQLPPKPPKGDVDVWEGFKEFWDAFAHKQNRPDSEKVWNRLKPNDELRAAIMSKVRAYVASTPDKQYRKHPAAWLRARKWEDEIVVKGQLALINGNRGHMPHDTRLKDYSDTGMDD